MTKYDCEKTRDFIHEWRRYSLSSDGLKDIQEDVQVNTWDDDAIERIQKWSDEHPEPPRIRREEREFIKAFKVRESKYIERYHGKLVLFIPNNQRFEQRFELWPDLFPFIAEGDKVSFEDLMKMEVEE